MEQIGHYCNISCKYDDSNCFQPDQFNLTWGYKYITDFLEKNGKKRKELDWENMFYARGKIARPAVYLYKNSLVEGSVEKVCRHKPIL